MSSIYGVVESARANSPGLESLRSGSGHRLAPPLATSRSSISVVVDGRPTNASITTDLIENQKTDLKHLNKKLARYVLYHNKLQKAIDHELETARKLRSQAGGKVHINLHKLTPLQKKSLEDLRNAIKRSTKASAGISERQRGIEYDKDRYDAARDKNDIIIRHLNDYILGLHSRQPEHEDRIRYLKQEVPHLRKQIQDDDFEFNQAKNDYLQKLSDKRNRHQHISAPEAPASTDELRRGLGKIRREIDGITKNMGRGQEISKLKTQLNSAHLREKELRKNIKDLDRSILETQSKALNERGQSELRRSEVQAIQQKNNLQMKLHNEQLPHLDDRIRNIEYDISRTKADIDTKGKEFHVRTIEAKRLNEEVDEMKRLLKLDEERTTFIRQNSIRESKKLAADRRNQWVASQKKQQVPTRKISPIPVPARRSRTVSSSSSSSSSSSDHRSQVLSNVGTHELARPLEGWDQVKGGTIRPVSKSTVDFDAERLYTSLTTTNIDRDLLIQILTNRTHEERQQIAACYRRLYKRELISHVNERTAARFKRLLINLLWTDAERDARQLHTAIQEANVELFMEVISTRPSRHLRHVQRDYFNIYKTDLLGRIHAAFDDVTYFIIKGMLENPRPIGTGDTFKIDHHSQEFRDARYLLTAQYTHMTMAGAGLDQLIEILAGRSFASLYLMMTQVWNEVLPSKPFIDFLKDKFHANKQLKTLLLTFSNFIVALPPSSFASILRRAVQARPTDDNRICHIITSRAEIDLVDIIENYQKYGDSLKRDIVNMDRLGGKTYYETALLSVCKLA